MNVCGIRKENIDTVILSHMHFDHTGNIHLFPDADIYAPKADFMFAQTTVRIRNDPDTYCGYCKKDLDVAVWQYHQVEEDFKIIPGSGGDQSSGRYAGAVVTCDSFGKREDFYFFDG